MPRSGRVIRFATVTLDSAQAGTAVVRSRDAYEANEGAFAEAWGKEKFPDLADIFTKVPYLAAWVVCTLKLTCGSVVRIDKS